MVNLHTKLTLLVLVILLSGCGSGAEDKAQGDKITSSISQSSTAIENDIPALIGEMRARSSLSEIDATMRELGWTQCPTGLPEKTGVFDGKQNLVKNISVIRKAFQKDDYIYVDLTVESSMAKKGDAIEISYDDNEVYAVERYHGEGLEVHPGIGNANGKVVDGSRSEYRFGFLLKNRSPDKSVTIPVVINMELSGKYYFWEAIILTDSDATMSVNHLESPNPLSSQYL